MQITTSATEYDRKFPFFSKPELIGEYTIDRERTIHNGREHARYLRIVDPATRVAFDLSNGKATFEEKEGNERLDVLLEWIRLQAPDSSASPKKVLHEADVVCWRGLLTRIAATPFASRDAWRCVAVRAGDVIYLCEYDTNEAIARKANEDERSKLMSYWGHKFEQYMKSAEKGGEPDTESPVSCKEEFAVVVRSRLTLPDGSLCRLAYGAEVDALDGDGSLVEMKTQAGNFNEGFRRHKSLKWWLQSFLVGIDSVVVGFRNDQGIVERVGTVQLSELTRQGHWKGNICFNFLAMVLGRIKAALSSRESIHVFHDPKSSSVCFGDAAKQEADFLTPEFRRYFKLEPES